LEKRKREAEQPGEWTVFPEAGGRGMEVKTRQQNALIRGGNGEGKKAGGEVADGLVQERKEERRTKNSSSRKITIKKGAKERSSP